VSDKHANFIVVDAGARAADVYALLGLVAQRVADRCGVRLVPEVRVVGSFPASDAG
jgi:UDP-N-acetylmuramate dehydrogenase